MYNWLRWSVEPQPVNLSRRLQCHRAAILPSPTNRIPIILVPGTVLHNKVGGYRLACHWFKQNKSLVLLQRATAVLVESEGESNRWQHWRAS